MGTRYNIVVTATDAATARVRAIKQGLANVVRPITDVGRSVKALGKETGINKIAQGVGALGTNAMGAIRALGGLSPALAGLTAAGGIAAIAAYGKNLIYAQSATLRFAQTSGVAAERVQIMEGAAKLAGLQVGDMDSAIMSLGTTMQDARWGRNQGALLMMNRLGMQMKTTKDGAIDTAATIGDLADIFGPGGKLAKAPVQTKLLVAQQFGVEALLPLLMKGRKAWEDYQREAEKAKPPISKEDLEAADQYRKEIDKMSLSFDGLGAAIMKRAMPGISAFSKWVSEHNQRAADNIRKNGIGGALANGYARTVNDAYQAVYGNPGRAIQEYFTRDRGPIKPKNPKAEQESIADFKRMGWSDAQAKGIVANQLAESQLDARAVGDGGKAKGSMQWHPDRQANYAKWAKDQKDVQGKTIDTSTLADQRKFINYELRHGAEQRAGKRLAAQTNSGDAAFVLSQDYVRPAARMSEAARRGVTALEMDKRYAADSAATDPRKVANSKEEVPAQRYVMGSDPAAEAKLAGKDPSLGQVWKSPTQKVQAESTVNLKITGLPSGTKAEIVDSAGPVKTTLKQESSMPDYNL